MIRTFAIFTCAILCASLAVAQEKKTDKEGNIKKSEKIPVCGVGKTKKGNEFVWVRLTKGQFEYTKKMFFKKASATKTTKIDNQKTKPNRVKIILTKNQREQLKKLMGFEIRRAVFVSNRVLTHKRHHWTFLKKFALQKLKVRAKKKETKSAKKKEKKASQ